MSKLYLKLPMNNISFCISDLNDNIIVEHDPAKNEPFKQVCLESGVYLLKFDFNGKRIIKTVVVN